MKKEDIPWKRGIVVSLLVVLLSFSFAEGLLFLQDQTIISETYTSEQTTIITLLNDQPRSQNILIQLSPQSEYLSKYLELEDTAITLIPGEKKNILLNTALPEEGLSPEKHIIELIAKSDDDKSVAKTKIFFNVPGIAKPQLEIGEEEFNLDKEEKTILVELKNTGNVIMRPQPNIIISKGKETVKEIEYKTPIQIMPQESYLLHMRIDTSSLEPALYELDVTFTDRDHIELNTKTNTFEVKSEYEETTTKQNFTTPLIIISILIILGGALYVVNKQLKKQEDPLTIKLAQLEKREKKLEKELQKLINETHQTISTSNKWIRKNIGEEYELR